jgi:hypothetical protein
MQLQDRLFTALIALAVLVAVVWTAVMVLSR